MDLGMKLKTHRTASGLSQEAVAQQLQVTRQAVTKWENNRAVPSAAHLIQLSALFGISLAQLTGTDEPVKQGDRPKNLRYGLYAAAAWLALFLLCRIIDGMDPEQTALTWLFGTDPKYSSYLFGWLIGNGLYFWCSLLSILTAALGRIRFSGTFAAAFALCVPLGEWLGNGAAAGYHFGWLLWILFSILGLIQGIALERLHKKGRDLRSGAMKLWIAVTLLAAAAICVGVFWYAQTYLPPHP